MSCHILIIADGRSPTTHSWLANIQALGYETSLISTYPCQPPKNLRQFSVIPVAFSQFGSTQGGNNRSSVNTLKKLRHAIAPLLQTLRYYLGPLTLKQAAERLKQAVKVHQPDLIHALRIPFEGMLGSYTPGEIPLIVSTWGNDLTLHAQGSFLMRKFTQRCLRRASGFMSDTHRDMRLAAKLGLASNTSTIVVPGSGGLDLTAINNAPPLDPKRYMLPNTGSWVVNPRGIRPGSVHQEVFFASIPQILAHRPETRFICPNLAGSNRAKDWVAQYQVEDDVLLLPKLPQAELWGLFKQAKVFVSPSSHDGTPNALLEAMACGCFPVVGEIESMLEWIEPGENGLCVNPRDPEALAQAVLTALDNPKLIRNAAIRNLEIIKSRAAQVVTHPKIDTFYRQFCP
ncbi:MAG: glycosyltransferase [Anaerolineales bacterium]